VAGPAGVRVLDVLAHDGEVAEIEPPSGKVPNTGRPSHGVPAGNRPGLSRVAPEAASAPPHTDDDEGDETCQRERQQSKRPVSLEFPEARAGFWRKVKTRSHPEVELLCQCASLPVKHWEILPRSA
jgi:hypothetical protein